MCELAFRRAEPASYRVINGGWGPIELPNYPPSEEGRALRAPRVELKLSLRDAAAALGVGVIEASELETGRATCNWQIARQRLFEAAGA